MPPLSEMLGAQNLAGFAPTENKPQPPPSKMEEVAGLNPYLRCPLPPFSTTVDTIRQWNMSGKSPVMRVIPLPTQQGAAGGSSTNVTNVTTTTSGGGGTAPTPTLQPLTAVLNVAALPANGTLQSLLKLTAKSFQLIQIASTVPIEARLYATQSTQIADIARPTDTPVPFETVPGLITDIVFDTVPYQWNWQNRIAANADVVQDTNLYITIVNPSSVTGTAAAVVTITYLPLEAA